VIRSFRDEEIKRISNRQRTHPLDDGIRVNQQWPICFRGTDTGAEEVELVDCH
jgi:plasmid maintenance system killer protein